jgi:hypothetical protein
VSVNLSLTPSIVERNKKRLHTSNRQGSLASYTAKLSCFGIQSREFSEVEMSEFSTAEVDQNVYFLTRFCYTKKTLI